MTKFLGVCSFLLFFCSFSTQAVTNPQSIGKTSTSKAFYRDDQLWPLTLNTVTNKYEIPVCWENLTEINNTSLHPAVSPRLKTWKQRRLDTIAYINAAWGDITNNTTNPIGNGSISLLSFVDKNQCPLWPAKFSGVRILANSTLKIVLPFPYPNQPPPYVRALGSKLNNLHNGVVLNFDNTSIYNNACKGQLVSEENCYKATVIHEFGHVVGMSHEHNRTDQPLSYQTRLCALDDPKSVIDPSTGLGQLTFGNLRIGVFDNTSIMDYCNANRIKNPVLSLTDKVALRVFYGRMPSLNLDLGYPVITIPVVLRGITKAPYSLQLSDPTNTGNYKPVFSIAPTTGKSSVPATYLNSVLTIPYLKVTSFGKVIGIQSRTMTLQLITGYFRNTTKTNIYTTARQ